MSGKNPMDNAIVRFVTQKKHKWRGTYVRIFALTSTQILNVDPNSWNVTNSWNYDPDLVSFSPSVSNDVEFTLTLKVRHTRLAWLLFSSRSCFSHVALDRRFEYRISNIEYRI